MKESESTGDLRAKLRFWQVTPRVLPEEFEREVWHRIGARRTARRRARWRALGWGLVLLGLLALAWRAAHGRAHPAQGGQGGLRGSSRVDSRKLSVFVVQNAHEGKETALRVRFF